MSEIYFIRHGQASFGAENYDRLSPTGERQAEVLARFLDTNGIRFDSIYCGTMERQRDTALPLCRRQDAEPHIMTAFNEYDHKALIMARAQRGKSRGTPADIPSEHLLRDMKAFQVYFGETVDQWMAGDYDKVPGVESWTDFCSRVAAGVEEIIADQGSGRRLAVFTSGGPISVVVRNAMGLSDHKTLEISWEILNASITCLKYGGSRRTLTSFNNSSHLLMEGDPGLLTLR